MYCLLKVYFNKPGSTKYIILELLTKYLAHNFILIELLLSKKQEVEILVL